MKSPLTRHAGLVMRIITALSVFTSLLPVTPVRQAQADNALVQISEVMAGVNGDPQIQFLEILVADNSQKSWGPQAGESAGRAMLVFYDHTGNQTGRYVFPGDPGGTGVRVLIATQAFADQPGAPAPDFIITPEVMALNGKVCFKNNPHNPNGGPVNLCLSYGSFTGDTEGAGAPAAALPILNPISLRRFQNLTAFGAASNSNADFALLPPTPRNTAGATFSMVAQPPVEQGRNLFMLETFNGNGRTCGTCHRAEDNFGIRPSFIAALPREDPVFVANFNLNTLTLLDDAQPSDLRGVITATNGVTATVLAGKAVRTYLVHGGADMSGTVVDGNGNTGVIESVTPGDLTMLEDPRLLEGPRALFQVDPDGFGAGSVFRKPPNLLNLGLTAPFGLEGRFANTQEFSVGAVRQHLPRSMARVDDVDFRLPTASELQALQAFLLSLFMPADQDFTIDRFVTTEAQKRGRALFFSEFSNGMNCDSCHDTTVLAGRFSFNTQVGRLPINGPSGDNLPQDLREFNTPPLFGVKRAAPYFHDNSVQTLREAVAFYFGPEFQSGPDAFLVNPAFGTDQNIDDVTALLEALVDRPFTVAPQSTDFGSLLVGSGAGPPQTITVVNTLATPLTITGVVLNGLGAGDYVITSFPADTPFGENESRTIDVAFQPVTAGAVSATLELTVTDGSETWAWGVALSGTGLLADAGTLQGTVTDASTGSPINGATVAIDTFTAVTDSTGFYRIVNIPTGTYDVTASMSGYTSSTVTGVVIGSGGTTTQDLALTPAGCVSACLRSTSIALRSTQVDVTGRVTVRDETGLVQSLATVTAIWTLPGGSTQAQTATTSSRGTANFAVSGGAGTYTLTVTGITKTGFTFDPTNSVLSSSITK